MASFWQSYGLTHDPFSNENPKYIPFFPSRWQQQLDLLGHLAVSTHMVLLITALSGVGKTTFMEILLNQLQTQAGLCRIHGNNTISVEVMQDLIGQHIGMVPGEGSFQVRFKTHIERMAEAKDEFYFIVDDAHQLPKSTLSLLINAAEWQTVDKHPLHFILLGGPQLDAIMAEITAQHLGEIMTHSIRLEPFSLEMTKDYVMHRFVQAGFAHDFPFKSAQIQQLYQTTNGIASKINALAAQILTGAIPTKNAKPKAVMQQKPSTPKEKVRKNQPESDRASSLSWKWFTTGIVSVLAVVLFMVLFFRSSGETLTPITALALHDESDTTMPAAELTDQTSIEAEQTQAEGLNGMVASGHAQVVVATNDQAVIQPAPAPVSTPINDSPAVPVTITPAPIAPVYLPSAPLDAVAPEPTAPAAEKINSQWQSLSSSAAVVNQEKITPHYVAKTANMVKPKVVASAHKAPVAATASLTQDERALLSMPAQHVTLQIAAASNYLKLKQYIKSAGLNQETYFFKVDRHGEPWFVAVYGDYASAGEAVKNIHTLPESITQKEKPWPRSFENIQSLIKRKA